MVGGQSRSRRTWEVELSASTYTGTCLAGEHHLDGGEGEAELIGAQPARFRGVGECRGEAGIAGGGAGLLEREKSHRVHTWELSGLALS